MRKRESNKARFAVGEGAIEEEVVAKRESVDLPNLKNLEQIEGRRGSQEGGVDMRDLSSVKNPGKSPIETFETKSTLKKKKKK